MKRFWLQGFLVFAALLAAGCSSSKTPQAAVPQPVSPSVQPVAASAPLPATRAVTASSAYPPITSLTKGMLIVGTVPGRAKVYLNNEFLGVTPLKVELEPGLHAVSIKLEGYRMIAGKITVHSGEHTEMDMTLER